MFDSTSLEDQVEEALSAKSPRKAVSPDLHFGLWTIAFSTKVLKNVKFEAESFLALSFSASS